MLLIASYVFYGWWDWRFTGLLLFSSILDYYLSLAIHHSETPGKRKRLVLVSIVVNLGLLGVFKYFNFFIGSAAEIIHWLGFQPNLPALNIILPAGISFYTFQTMSYTLDVYRRHCAPSRDFWSYMLYVAYFPQLVAGPIVRSEELLPQLQKKRTVSNEHWRTGAILILIGLFKKVAIADVLAPDIERFFSAPANFSSLALIKGLYFFSLQIYCDFSGYTDIARGVSRLMGIELPENFNQPYLARTITEFWRRWHMSLSSWLRDYVYIPLGGNRQGRFNTYRNLFITMFLGGLWHGANWTFIVWGCLHGIYLAAHKLFMAPASQDTQMKPRKNPGVVTTVLSCFFTFNLVSLTWIFFRAPSFSSAFDYLSGITNWHGGFNPLQLAVPAFYLGLILAIDLPQYFSRDHTIILKAPWFLRGLIYAGMIMMIALSDTGHVTPFIYFQF